MKKAVLIFVIVLVVMVVLYFSKQQKEIEKQEEIEAEVKSAEAKEQVKEIITSTTRTETTPWGNDVYTSVEQQLINSIAAKIITDVKGSGGHMDKTALPAYEQAAALDLRKTWLLGSYLAQNQWFLKNGNIGDGNISIRKALNTQKWTAGTYTGSGEWSQKRRKERITAAITQLLKNLEKVGW